MEASAAKQEAEENLELLSTAEEERDQAISDFLEIKAHNAHLQQRIERFEKQPRGVGELITAEIPASLENFEEWCHENLDGAVTLLPRAFRAVEKSQYEDVKLIYKALLLLRDSYVPMRREGGSKRNESFKKVCADLGIEEKPSFSGNRWGEHGDTYRVRYNGQNRLLKRHLKKGNARNKRECFRLYFFWEEEERQVVVGSLPAHLPTKIT